MPELEIAETRLDLVLPIANIEAGNARIVEITGATDYLDFNIAAPLTSDGVNIDYRGSSCPFNDDWLDDLMDPENPWVAMVNSEDPNTAEAFTANIASCTPSLMRYSPD
jgi:hypothetical protein